MKVLFIGGTGIISSACSPLAIESGIDLYLLNRGRSLRPAPAGAKLLEGDIRDEGSARSALEGHVWDAVVDWIAFTTDHIERDIELFKGRTRQFVFISSASAYQTPASNLPIRESTPLDNPFWEYSRNKIACEERLLRAYREERFPFTVVRPSHTYDRTLLPFDNGYTVFRRMLEGKPVVVHGDGASIWTLTHHADFAKGFVPLLGHSGAIGEAIHITSDEWLTWNQIYDIVAGAAGVDAKKVHVPSEVIARYDAGWGASLLGDKTNSSIFDNSKVKALVPGFACSIPFSRGAEEIVRYYLEDPSRGSVNPEKDALLDRLVTEFG
jgi:nucleoside-diphosphate-sugar epimerase